MIQAKVIADSKNIFGDRITTMVCTFPRFILAEFNTHRMFSRNSASSRAIPFKKMVEMVRTNPFIPIAWQKDHPGMQGTEYFTDPDDIQYLINNHLDARNFAIYRAEAASKKGLTKQLCNRYLEPFMWHTCIVTSTEWDNFWRLRCPKYDISGELYRSKKDVYKDYKPISQGGISGILDYNDPNWLKLNKGQAEIHMMALAEAMWDAYNESQPKLLQPGEWHVPYGDIFNEDRLQLMNKVRDEDSDMDGFLYNRQGVEWNKLQIATARCARVSYLNHEGKDDYEADLDLYGSLLVRPYTDKKGRVFTKDDPIHASPSEHCAKSMSDEDLNDYVKIDNGIVQEGWCRNFRGFIQLRAMIEK